MRNKNRVGLVMMVMIIVLINGFWVSGELQRFEHPPKSNSTLTLLVVGDWGRNGHFNQSQVAFQMGRIGEELDIDMVISTGDNFYDDGLKGEHDPNFLDSFTNIYTAKSLQKQWFSVLGNHDYRGDALAQMSPLLRQIDSRWLCLRSVIVNAEIAELFFVDTTPFVSGYLTRPEDHIYDWRGVSPLKAYTAKLLKDVESALKESRARWKIVVGHHAIRSVGHHGDTQGVFVLGLARMDVGLCDHVSTRVWDANNVDLYMNGHDHCLQHISDDKSTIQFLTSGAGSKAWRGDIDTLNHQNLKFFYDGQGFMTVQLTSNDVEIAFYDVFGVILHTWTMSKYPMHSIM